MLANLAGSLWMSNVQAGKLDDLEEAIMFECAVMEHEAEDHQDRSVTPVNPARSVWMGFVRNGRMDDIEKAIELERAILELRLEGHPDRWPISGLPEGTLGTRREDGGS
ncbi:hypothetical protein ACEPAF_5996 [Sanghuangporus sanghuang]